MKIGELSRRTGFPVKTLRYYDEIGLIRPARRNSAYGHRRYGEDALDILALIRSAKLAGLSLGRIKKVIRAARQGYACEEVIPLLNEKIEEIDRAIRSLRELRSRLGRALKRGFPKETKPCECPILEGLAEISK